MLSKILFFQLLILSLFTTSILSTNLDLYVKRTKDPESPDGSHDHPFQELQDCLLHISKLTTSQSQVTIKLAPSFEPYSFGQSNWLLNSTSIEEFILTSWETDSEGGEEQALPILDLTGSSLKVSKTKFTLSNMKVLAGDGTIHIQESIIRLENLDFDRLGGKESLIKIEDSAEVTIIGLSVRTTNSRARLINCSLNNFPLSPKIKVENVRVLANNSKNNNKFPLLTFTQSPHPGDASKHPQMTGEVILKHLQIQAIHPSSNFTPPPVFAISHFETVSFENFAWENVSISVGDYAVGYFESNNIMTFRNISIKKSNISVTTTAADPLFTVTNTRSFILENIVLHSNFIHVFAPNFFLVSLYTIQNVMLLDHSIIENNFLGNVQIISLMTDKTTERPIPLQHKTVLKFSDVKITGNRNRNFTHSFCYFKLETSILLSFSLTNAEFSSNELPGKVFFFQNQLPSTSTSQLGSTPLEFADITIQNNTEAPDTSFFYFSPSYDTQLEVDCTHGLDPFKMNFKTLTVSNNRFTRGYNIDWISHSSVFQSKFAQIQIDHSTFSHNHFEFYSLFTVDEKPSNILIKDSHFHNNTLNSSFLVNSNDWKTCQLCTEFSPEVGEPMKILYRLNLLQSCKFSDISLHSSTLFSLSNGYFYVQNNSFDRITLVQSKLITTTFKHLKLSSVSSGFTRDRTLEILTFSWSFLSSEFEEIMKQNLAYHENPTYFYVFMNNTLSNIFIESSTLISIKGYAFSSGMIRIQENKLLTIRASDLSTTSRILSCENFHSMFIEDNSLENIKGVSIFSFSKNDNSNLLQLQRNRIKEIKVGSFLSYEGEELKNMQISHNIFSDIKLSIGCFLIETGISSGNYTINSNSFIGVGLNFKPTNSIHELSAFLLISSESLGSAQFSKISFDNNTFHYFVIKTSSQRGSINTIEIESPQWVEMRNTNFSNIESTAKGGLLHVSNSANFSISYCEFERIVIDNINGFIFSDSRLVSIQNSSFQILSNYEAGGVFFLIPEQEKHTVRITNSSFISIDIGRLGKIFTLQSFSSDKEPESEEAPTLILDLEVSNCFLRDRTENTLFYLSHGTCSPCVVNNTQIEGFFDEAPIQNIVHIQQTAGRFILQNFALPRNWNQAVPSVLIEKSLIEFTIQGFVFNGRNLSLFLVRFDFGNLIIKDSLFQNITLVQYPIIAIERGFPDDSDIFWLSSRVVFENVTFRGIRGPPQKHEMKNLLSFLSAKVSENEEISAPAIFASSVPLELSVHNSTFQDLLDTQAFLFMMSFSSMLWIPSAFNISSSTFSNLSSIAGPAISVLQDNAPFVVRITDSNFTDCSAYGGGAFVFYNSSLTMSDTTFRNVHAELQGAVAFLGGEFQNERSLTNVNFLNTTARHGSNFSHYAMNFKISFVSNQSHGISMTSAEKPLIAQRFQMKNVSNSEFQAGYLQLEFVDANGEKAIEMSLTKQADLQLRTLTDSSFQSTRIQAHPIIVDDFTILLPLKNLTLTGRAHKNFEVSVLYNSSFERKRTFEISMRDCLPGEYYNSFVCEPCEKSTYSLNPKQPCTRCPQNAECQGHSKICPISGYWNANDSSTTILPCLDGEFGRCHSEKRTGCRNCREGHTGPMCQACEFEMGYVESGFFECEKCINPARSLFWTLIFATAYFLFQVFSIYSLYKGVDRIDGSVLETRRTERSFYIKSLMTYGQLMSIICITSPQIYKYVGLISQMGNPSFLIVYGTQCALKALGVDHQNFIYYQTNLVMALPFIQIPFILIMFSIIRKIRPEIQLKKIASYATFYLIVSYQPGVATALSLFLSCATLKDLDYTFIASHPNWQCDDRHDSISRFLVQPSIILWCVVIPTAIFFIHKKNHQKLQTEENRFTIISTELKEENYQWGLIAMVFKLGASLLLYGLENKLEIQIFTFLLLLWIYQSLVRLKQPYKESRFNKFEILLTNLLIFNIIVIRCLINPKEETTLGSLSLVIIAFLNCSFLIFVLAKILVSTFFSKFTTMEERLLEREASNFNKRMSNSPVFSNK